MRLIDAEALWVHLLQVSTEEELRSRYEVVEGIDKTLHCVSIAPTIEAKPVVHAHWISASWEEDEENGIENTYSDEFICSKCKEHLYFPDIIEKENIGFSFCPYCGAQMDEPISQTHENGVKIPVISMEDVPKLAKESD